MKKTPSPKQIEKYYKELVFYNTAFLKKPSFYVTWLFLHTPITATQVTALSGIVGVLGALLFVFEQPIYWIFGWLILNFYIILDLVDGEVARIKEQKSKFGRYLDHSFHPFLNAFVFIPMSFGLYSIFKDLSVFAFGLSATFFTLLFRIHNLSMTQYIPEDDKSERKDFKDYSLFEAIKGVFTELGGIFHTIAVCSGLDLFFGSSMFRLLFLVGCGGFFPLLYVWRLFRFRKLLIEKGLN